MSKIVAYADKIRDEISLNVTEIAGAVVVSDKPKDMETKLSISDALTNGTAIIVGFVRGTGRAGNSRTHYQIVINQKVEIAKAGTHKPAIEMVEAIMKRLDDRVLDGFCYQAIEVGEWDLVVKDKTFAVYKIDLFVHLDLT